MRVAIATAVLVLTACRGGPVEAPSDPAPSDPALLAPLPAAIAEPAAPSVRPSVRPSDRPAAVAEAPPPSAETPNATTPSKPVRPPVIETPPVATAATGDFLAPPGRVVRLAGVVSGRYALLERTSSTHDASTVRIDQVTRRGPGPERLDDASTGGYLVHTSDEELRIGLAPDELHRIPPPQRALVLPPRAGATWTAGERDNRIDVRIVAVEDVETFAGVRRGCARVESSDGHQRTIQWWDPELGVVRWEVFARGADTPRVAVALCGDTPPSVEALGKLLKVSLRGASTPRR